MSKFSGKKVPFISADEKSVAIRENHEITGFSVDNTVQQLFLKCAFRTGDISTVSLDPWVAGYLFWYLRRLLQDRSESAGSPMSLPADMGSETHGHWFPPE